VYGPVLIIHSWLRWATLFLAAGSTLSALRRDDDLSRRPPGAHWDAALMAAADLQVLFGLVLYFGLSSLTVDALNDFGSISGNSVLMFWAVWHVAAMLGAAVLVRVGRVLALSAKTSQQRRRRRLVAFAITTVVMLAATPWPGLSYARPLFRW